MIEVGQDINSSLNRSIHVAQSQYAYFCFFFILASAGTCGASGHAVVDVCQQLSVAVGGVWGVALGALQEAFIEEVGDFRR